MLSIKIITLTPPQTHYKNINVDSTVISGFLHMNEISHITFMNEYFFVNDSLDLLFDQVLTTKLHHLELH